MRLRSTFAAAGIAVAGVATLGVAPVHAAGLPAFTCTGTLAEPETIAGGAFTAINMPNGTLCGIDGPVWVAHWLTIGEGAGLFVLDGGSLTTHGPTTVGPAGAFGSIDNTIPVHLGGAVSVYHNGAFAIGTETPGGPIVNSIAGGVYGYGESTVQIHNATIAGPVKLTGGGGDNAIMDALGGFGAFNDLEDNTIHGAVIETGYQGIWAGVIRDVIQGSLTFSDNVQAPPQDEWDIGSDTIFGSATCNDNSPVPNTGESAGAPSTVFGPILGDQAATCTSAGP